MTDNTLSPDLTLRPHALRALDVYLFRRLGAGRTAWPLKHRLALLVSRWSWVPLVGVMAAALLRGQAALAPVLTALAVATLVQVLAKRTARVLSAPRPFALGLCANHLNHSLRGGMPSTHAMVMGCLAGSLAPWMGVWPELTVIPWIAVATAWARVQAGAHFPSDVMAGLGLGLMLGQLATRLLLQA